jgi:hypothetical protein
MNWQLNKAGKWLLGGGVVLAISMAALEPTWQSFVLLAVCLALLWWLARCLPRIASTGFLAIKTPPELALLLASTLLSLVLAEIGLRLFWTSDFPQIQDEKNLMYRYDEGLGWFPIPSSQRTIKTPTRTFSAVHNRQGFRDHEFTASNKPGILFLGDSFVWGYDVEAAERFTDKLQARHPEWAVFNFGVSGYGTDQEFLLLKRLFEQYKPRVVFLVFCTENDPGDNRHNVRNQGYFKPYFVTNEHGLELRGVPVPRSERSLYSGHPWLFRPYLMRLLARAWCKLRRPPRLLNQDPTGAILAALNQYVRDKGARFAVGLTEPQPEIEALLTRSEIPYVELSTNLRYPAQGEHWTPEGHSVVCQRIEQFLLDGGYLAPPR